jgi:hypothetical protein
MKNKIEDLRDHLFATIEGLLDKDTPLDVDRALAVAGVAKVIVDSAKVEVDAMRALNLTSGSGFLPDESPGRTGPRALASGRRR